MEYQTLVLNFLTSTFIVGIATYFIQKHIDKRFNKIEEFQKTLITIRKEKYDTLLRTLQEIWEKIIETEYFLRHGLPQQVMKANEANNNKKWSFDASPLLDTLLFIEKRSILLDRDLSDKTISLYVNHLEKTYNGYVAVLNEFAAKTKNLNDVNVFIPNALGDNYKKDLKELRAEFEKQSREILYNDN
ncbi:MAG TPA: hypothetical protein VF487_13625 [Chitinophagaceae bacterium]